MYTHCIKNLFIVTLEINSRIVLHQNHFSYFWANALTETLKENIHTHTYIYIYKETVKSPTYYSCFICTRMKDYTVSKSKKIFKYYYIYVHVYVYIY